MWLTWVCGGVCGGAEERERTKKMERNKRGRTKSAVESKEGRD